LTKKEKIKRKKDLVDIFVFIVLYISHYIFRQMQGKKESIKEINFFVSPFFGIKSTHIYSGLFMKFTVS